MIGLSGTTCCVLQEKSTRKLYNKSVTDQVIPVVMGTLGSLPLGLNDNLRTLEVGIPVDLR